MIHTCKYCKEQFEGNARAETCSTNCRKAYSNVKKYWRIWGITQPTTPDIKPAIQEPANKPKPVKSPPIKKEPQQPTQSRWQQVQEYKKRHKFDV